MDKAESKFYLGSLLNRQLQVHTTDSRMFVGDFKCTDNVSHFPFSSLTPHSYLFAFLHPLYSLPKILAGLVAQL